MTLGALKPREALDDSITSGKDLLHEESPAGGSGTARLDALAVTVCPRSTGDMKTWVSWWMTAHAKESSAIRQ